MEHILSLSYGKDSLACLGAIEQLGLPLDRIIHAEVWATDTIPADLPPMVEFKKKADAIIKKDMTSRLSTFGLTSLMKSNFTKSDTTKIKTLNAFMVFHVQSEHGATIALKLRY